MAPTELEPGEARELIGSLVRMGLCDPAETPTFSALAGGVSSAIFRVDLSSGPICVKRALSKLRVAADWEAPIERNANEAAWMRIASSIVEGSVPRVLGEDPASNTFAMAYLEPVAYPVWKEELRDGHVSPAFAAEVAKLLIAIHARTARDPAVANAFATDASFWSLRLEPYLIAAARRHPDCEKALVAIANRTAETRVALVHGDVSPKNILVGPAGPVILDAECAWYGDPAFDVAFCLNHLLLKSVWQPKLKRKLMDAFEAFVSTYLSAIDWEDRTVFEERAAALLPALMLARVDGKSPAEYLNSEGDRNLIRRFAKTRLIAPMRSLSVLGGDWVTAK